MKKKLKLNTETVRKLTTQQLVDIAGGAKPSIGHPKNCITDNSYTCPP